MYRNCQPKQKRTHHLSKHKLSTSFLCPQFFKKHNALEFSKSGSRKILSVAPTWRLALDGTYSRLFKLQAKGYQWRTFRQLTSASWHREKWGAAFLESKEYVGDYPPHLGCWLFTSRITLHFWDGESQPKPSFGWGGRSNKDTFIQILYWYWLPRWWQLKYFWCSPRTLGKIPILTNIFEMVWNHQLVVIDWW